MYMVIFFDDIKDTIIDVNEISNRIVVLKYINYFI
jgi:hypothetical protein